MENSSAKDKRKLRKVEAEKNRKLLSSKNDHDTDQLVASDDPNGIGLISMKLRNPIHHDQASIAGADRRLDIQVRNVTVGLNNGTTLLDNGELKFTYRRRYGLIGENGVGKSTLLKHIAAGSDMIPDFPDHLRVLHVRQEVSSHLSDQMSVLQAVLQSDVERQALLREEKALLTKLEGAGVGDITTHTSSTTSNGSSNDRSNNVNLSLQEKRKKILEHNATAPQSTVQSMQSDLQKLDDIYARLEIIGADSAEARAAMILSGLQFTPDMQHGPLSALSGGWKMRVALAAALFIEPDLCMLDEPTNHLDLEAVIWLERYLENYRHTLIVVSHDRGFLNSVCTDIIEFKHRRLTYYRGNFETYVKLRDEQIRNAMRQYQAYQAKREHMMEFINTFRANAKRATMVQSRIKAVEKMDAEAPLPVEVDSIWRFSIPTSEPVSRPIISVNDVSFDYIPVRNDGTKKLESEYLLQKVNFGVDLTSRIAILGANGQGKTTLLNLIMGKLKPLSGSVMINTSLRIGHFTQHSADNFNLSLSALENMLSMFDEADDQEMRSFLGKFQIHGNDAMKPMMLLSGGQKSRVAFAALAYKKPHVLVVDEGSNHLSMEAVDALIDAMNDFKGGIMVVSHDSHFVSHTCRELWVVHNGHATRFRGDFDEYKHHTTEITQKRVEESVKRVTAVNQ
jgi:ATP-binding cassette, subfamily F, member 3